MFGLLFLAFFLNGGHTNAKDNRVKVTLPTFDITINGHTVNNDYRKYPFIVYKDITYFPMTWYDSRLLGLESTWSQNYGLEIKKSKVTSSYEPYRTNKKNAQTNYADIREGTIKLNSATINNKKQDYPFLTFNQITYFPLTWKFAHDEFGWKYKWDAKKGLTITSDNPKIRTVHLPSESKASPVALFNGYYYFTEMDKTNHYVYRTPINNLKAKEKVFTYSIDMSYALNIVRDFFVKDEELWFYYHQGGGVMGSDVYVKVNKEGKGNVVHTGYLDFINTDRGTLIISFAVPPSNNNLSLIRNVKKDNEEKIGDSDLIYSWLTQKGVGGGYSYSRNTGTASIGNELYIIGSAFPENEKVRNQLYKINLDTNEQETIINVPINDFQMYNNNLYYVKESDQRLYKSTLDGTGEQLLSDKAVTRFVLTNNGVFYVPNNRKNDEMNHFYRVNHNGADHLLLQDKISRIETDNSQIYLELSSADYGMKILDSTGKLQVTITDSIDYWFIHQGQLIFTGKNGISTLNAP